MEFLFNSHGKHIANFVRGQLHSLRGKNIGHYLEQQRIFIDRRGRYLGEIVQGNRLIRSRNSPYRAVNFGVYGNYGKVGNYGNPGNAGKIGMPSGFEDIDSEKLSK